MATIAETLALALQHHQAGNHPQAEQLYHSILRTEPRNADALHLLGMLAHQRRDYPQALGYIRQAVSLNPQEASYYTNLGLVYQAMGQLHEAAACYRQALRLRPDSPETHNNLGATLAEQGSLEEASACYREALRLRPNYAKAHHNLGIALARQGQLEEAVACYQQALYLRPHYAEAYYNLGNALRDQGHWDEAAISFRQALSFQADYPDAHNNLGIVLREQGKLEEAIASYRQALRCRPDYPEAHNNLGVTLRDQKHLDEAIANFRQALVLRPDYAEAHDNLGKALLEQGRLEEASACYLQVIQLRPDYAEGHHNLAHALRLQGRLDEAAFYYRQVVALGPDNPEAHNNLGNVLGDQGQRDEAIACHREALRLRPDYPEALNNLGNALEDTGDLDEAVACYRKALALRPHLPEANYNLGNVLKEQNRLDEAEVHLREALRLKPDHPGMFSGLLMYLNYAPATTPATLLAEHRAWADRHPGKPPSSHANNPDPGRRLRVGYVSPDFRRHAVAGFLKPILAHHDPAQVEVFCYAEVPAPDAMTARFQSLAHHWRPTLGLTDDRLAELIRADGIDLLVDLAGHTAHNRLLVFPRKPAPVQLTYLGYPSTTGLATIDYRLTDAVADPPGEPACHSEELWRLPGSFCCYAPPDSAPAPAAAPALAKQHLTFGSFHSLAKLNGRVLDLWCRLLEAVPSARLLICRHTLAGTARERLHRELEQRGIAPARFELRKGAPASSGSYLDLYAEVDLLLDTFPWGGHTTACESLWMGVPVLTLAGDRHASRMVSSVLHCLDLAHWVARTPEEFIERGLRLTGNLDGLVELRRALREKMRASSLCDCLAFTRHLEEAYRAMWQRWCAGRKTVEP